MQQTFLLIAGILGMSLILSVVVHAFARLKIEQHKTLQKLIDQGVAGDDLLRAAGLRTRGDRDRRLAMLLIAIGAGWSSITFFIGGWAWIAGFFPIVVGLAYLLLRKLDARDAG